MKTVLLIDDLREPEWIRKPGTDSDRYSEEETQVAKDAEAGIEQLKNGIWHTLLLDHDMGPGKNGMDVIKFLDENRHLIPAKVYLVTANIITGPRMLDYLRDWKDAGIIKEFTWIQ